MSDKEMVQLDVFGVVVVWVIRFLRCSGSCTDECNSKKLSNFIVLFPAFLGLVFFSVCACYLRGISS